MHRRSGMDMSASDPKLTRFAAKQKSAFNRDRMTPPFIRGFIAVGSLEKWTLSRCRTI